VDLDRQAIERRDFPISRRGYDTAAVDAHLQGLAGDFEELQRAAAGGGELSLAASTASHVQSIIQAAETAAAEIERQATDDARRMREEADRDAAGTRENAIARARAHVAAVEQATAALLERVGALDGEAGSLVETLRTHAGRLSKDLSAVERNMAHLYDAASGQAPAAAAPVAEQAAATASPPSGDPLAELVTAAPPPPSAPAPPTPAPQAPSTQAPPTPAPAAAGGGDLDGARLVALNMALNGESREQTDRYLAENFELVDRPKLIAEVYAAIEG
jgi:hypothetical protein